VSLDVEVLREIRDELRAFRLLYKELVERLIPVEEPSERERKALKEKDEIADEEELMRTLS